MELGIGWLDELVITTSNEYELDDSGGDPTACHKGTIPGCAYCPLCQEMEEIEVWFGVASPLIALSYKLKNKLIDEILRLIPDYPDTTPTLKNEAKVRRERRSELRQKHPRCHKCGILLGPGHVCTDIFQYKGKNYGRDCFEIVTETEDNSVNKEEFIPIEVI